MENGEKTAGGEIPEELEILKTLGISEVMLAGYVTVEAEFDLSEETRRIGGCCPLWESSAQHHGISAVYAPLAASQEPVVEIDSPGGIYGESPFPHPCHSPGKLL